tara:strand:- start:526 stop:648 length:123 start_codon:yes stop_codon:yes gene_type:complete
MVSSELIRVWITSDGTKFLDKSEAKAYDELNKKGDNSELD